MIMAAASEAVPPPVRDVLTAPEVTAAITALLVVIIGLMTALLQRHKRELEQGQTSVRVGVARAIDEASRAADAATMAAAQTTNSHGTNLRDDIDGIRTAIAAVMARMDVIESARQASVEEMNADLRDLRDEHRDLSRRLGHEIGEIRRDKLSEHGDMQARLGRLEDDSRRARGTDTEE